MLLFTAETTDKKLVNLESVKLKSENQQTELIYYADKNFDTRIYVPWMKCVFRKEDHASNSIPKDDEPIVISDSDTDDNDSATPQCKYFLATNTNANFKRKCRIGEVISKIRLIFVVIFRQ